MNRHAEELNQSTGLSPVPLTPAEREARKSDLHKAEDVIYTMNHAATCLGLADTLVTPAIAAGLTVMTGTQWGEHHHEEGEKESLFFRDFLKKSYWAETWDGLKANLTHVRENFATRPFWAELWHSSKKWALAEAIGDIGAVPVTLAAQRLAPGFMHSLRVAMEPAIGGIFRRRATAAAQSWANKQGLAYDAPEVVARAEKLYNYEMDHMPQMALWTAASIGINYGVTKKIQPEISLLEFAKVKALGSAVTASIVFGARATSPAKAHWWDEHVGKHTIIPITKTVGGLFGIKGSDVDHFHAQDDDKPAAKTATRWAERCERYRCGGDAGCSGDNALALRRGPRFNHKR